MESVILVTFNSNAEARLAFDGIDPRSADVPCTIHDMAIVAKADGKLSMLNNSTRGVDSSDDAIYGAILGTVIGILGGPLGMLIGACVGTGTGAVIDAADIDEEDAMLIRVSTILAEGEEAIAAYVTEDDTEEFDGLFADYDVTIYRFAAEDVAAEIDSAKRLQHKIAHALRQELKAQGD